MDAQRLYYTFEAPIGQVVVTLRGGFIEEISLLTKERRLGGFAGHPMDALPGQGRGGAPDEDDRVFERALGQFREYFAGERREFDLPLRPAGTPFQQAVWRALREIPYGEVRTYGEIAAAVGNPRAGRAVGMANNRNPLSIVVPCHRVVGAGGRLVGYGGSLEVKAFLLALEAGRREPLRAPGSVSPKMKVQEIAGI